MVDKLEQQRKNFQLFMERKKLTAYSWAKMSGITEGTIRSFLSGRSNSLTYKTLSKLAQAVGVTPKEIIDPYADYAEMIDSKEYLLRELFVSCIETIDEIIAKQKVSVSSKDRIKLYLTWYDIKYESKNKKENYKLDEEKILAMLRLVV